MDNLLKGDIASEINARRPGNLETDFPGEINVASEDITDEAFDIVDLRGGGGSIKRVINTGDATYLNNCGGEQYTLHFIKYEDYLNQFRLEDGRDWARGMSRPDYLVLTAGENDYFIFHELSAGQIRSKRSKAVNQLLAALRFLYTIPSVQYYINKYNHKHCYISAAGCPDTKTPRGVATGFMEIYRQISDPQPIHNQSIERMGFCAFATNTVRLNRD